MKKTIFTLATLVISALSILIFDSCKKEEELKSTICTPPNPPKASSNSPLSTGDILILNVETIPGATYNWTGPNGFSSTTQNPQLTFSRTNAGIYKVTATVDGCTSEPYATYVNSCETMASTNSPAIYSKKLYLNATSVLDAYGQIVPSTYSWVGPNGFTSNKQNDSISNVPMEAAGMYIVTATTNTGRISHDTTTVFIQPGAVLSITANTPLVGGSLNLATQTISGATYNWQGPNGFTSSTQNPTITNVTRQAIGTYSVTYTLNGIESLSRSKDVYVKYSGAGCTGGNSVAAGDSIFYNGVWYKYVDITGGSQCWLTGNLKKATSAPGNPYYFKYSQAKPAADTQGVCPTGWHLPTNSDWQNLSVAVGGDGNALKALGEGTGAGAGTNSSGFSATLGIGNTAKYWSVTETGQTHAIAMQLTQTNNIILTNLLSTTDSTFVRCIKD